MLTFEVLSNIQCVKWTGLQVLCRSTLSVQVLHNLFKDYKHESCPYTVYVNSE